MLTGRLYGLAYVTSSSPMWMVPSVGSSSPATIRSVVVLPQPDGPSSAKNDPDGMVRDRSSTATKVAEALRDPVQPQVLARGAGLARHQLPITFWKASLYVVSSSGVRLRNTFTFARSSSVGKISGLSTSDGSIFSISSLAPSTGQM